MDEKRVLSAPDMSMLMDTRLKLAGIKKDDFLAWQKAPVEPFAGSTYYEELMAVGYHPQLRELMGVINVKQTNGYNGSCPGSYGSAQYVRFYVNWSDSGTFTDSWEDQGVGTVYVFDPGTANSGKLPLMYSVRKSIMFPGSLLNHLVGGCAVKKVRAILSWATPPPSGQPNWQPGWGNVINTNVRFHI